MSSSLNEENGSIIKNTTRSGTKDTQENVIRNRNTTNSSTPDKGYAGLLGVKVGQKPSPLKQRNKKSCLNIKKNTDSDKESTHAYNELSHKMSETRINDADKLIYIKTTNNVENCNDKEVEVYGSETSVNLNSISNPSKVDRGGKITITPFNNPLRNTNDMSQAQMNQSNCKGTDSFHGLPLLSQCTPSNGTSLSSLASNHLNGTVSVEHGSKPITNFGASLPTLSTCRPSTGISLSSLATDHLSESMTTNPQSINFSNHMSVSSDHAPRPSGFTLNSLTPQHLTSTLSSEPGLSLGSLASNHLSSNSTSASMVGSSQFKIPALFGPKVSMGTYKNHQQRARSASPESEIDLMAALQLGSVVQEVAEEIEEPCVAKKIVLSVPDLFKLKSNLRKRKKSPFSQALTRKWARTIPFRQLSIILPSSDVQLFQFDIPSPDDIVLKAQSQSKAFNRSSPSIINNASTESQ